MKKIHVISWYDPLTKKIQIEYFYSNHKAVKKLYDIIGDYDGDHPNADPDEDFLTAATHYEEWMAHYSPESVVVQALIIYT
jgi:hypothetical protein